LKHSNNPLLHGAFGNSVIDRKDGEFQLVDLQFEI